MSSIHRCIDFARAPRVNARHPRLTIMVWAAPLVFALVAALLLASAAAVQAQAGPAGIAQALTPSQVVVAGTIGDVEQRTVVLRLPSTATNLRFMAQDLTSAAGGHGAAGQCHFRDAAISDGERLCAYRYDYEPAHLYGDC